VEEAYPVTGRGRPGACRLECDQGYYTPRPVTIRWEVGGHRIVIKIGCKLL
jgi:hypothetical protein